MREGIFGWSLPPGVTSSMLPGNSSYDEQCTQCGNHLDNCVCPECSECGDVGNPDCYDPSHKYYHGMKLNDEQIDGLVLAQERLYWLLEAERMVEDTYFQDYEESAENISYREWRENQDR